MCIYIIPLLWWNMMDQGGNRRLKCPQTATHAMPAAGTRTAGPWAAPLLCAELDWAENPEQWSARQAHTGCFCCVWVDTSQVLTPPQSTLCLMSLHLPYGLVISWACRISGAKLAHTKPQDSSCRDQHRESKCECSAAGPRQETAHRLSGGYRLLCQELLEECRQNVAFNSCWGYTFLLITLIKTSSW